jgi:hypothetical protein
MIDKKERIGQNANETERYESDKKPQPQPKAQRKPWT